MTRCIAQSRGAVAATSSLTDKESLLSEPLSTHQRIESVKELIHSVDKALIIFCRCKRAEHILDMLRHVGRDFGTRCQHVLDYPFLPRMRSFVAGKDDVEVA